MGLHPVALTSLLKEIARENEGGRGSGEGKRGENIYHREMERKGEREREKVSERARESVCVWLYAGVDWGVRSWVQGSGREKGVDNGKKSESHGLLLFF